MLKRLTERLDEGRQLLLTACVVGALLVAAALIPLLFRTAVPAPAPASYGSELEHRTALFTDFWANGGEAAAEVASIIPDREMETFCEDRMRTIVSRAVDDRAFTYTVPTGREYTRVSDGSGATVKLCRMWLQSQGDWQNWVDACFDAETGRIYYLYVSRECLTNRSRYSGAREGWDSAGAVARTLAAESGMTLRHFTGENRSGTAVLEGEDGLLCYELQFAGYDALIDLRVVCV